MGNLLDLEPEQFILKPAFATIQCEPGWQWRKRKDPMPDYDLFYVWKGEGTITLNQKDYPVSKGHCFLFRPGDEVSGTHLADNPLALTYIHFDVAKAPYLVPETHRVLEDPIFFESLLSQYVRLFLIQTFGAEIEAQLILKQLMIHLLREEQEQGKPYKETTNQSTIEVIQEVANYVKQHPADFHTVESMAARASLSPRYFSLKFKEIIGQTAKSYIVENRIKRAEHLLHYAGMSVTEAAEALGYRNLHFFSRQFKQYTGRNASDVRMRKPSRRQNATQ